MITLNWLVKWLEKNLKYFSVPGQLELLLADYSLGLKYNRTKQWQLQPLNTMSSYSEIKKSTKHWIKRYEGGRQHLFLARLMLLLFLRSNRSSSDDEVVSLLWMACFFTLGKQNKLDLMMLHFTFIFRVLFILMTGCWNVEQLSVSNRFPPNMASPCWGSVGVK